MSDILLHFKGELLIIPNLRYNIDHAGRFFKTFDVYKVVRDSKNLYNAARITLIRDRRKKLCQKYKRMGNYIFFLVERNGQLYHTSITISNLLEDESPFLISIYWLGFQLLSTMPQELAQSEFERKSYVRYTISF